MLSHALGDGGGRRRGGTEGAAVVLGVCQDFCSGGPSALVLGKAGAGKGGGGRREAGEAAARAAAAGR